MSTDAPVVLIVEDEPAVADSFEVMLEEQYEVLKADSGREALETLDEHSVDVVLLDRMMPGMSGDEVLEAIRGRDYDCRVAMVTAVDPDFEIIEMGFDDYITKPPTREELRGTVEELLERSDYGEQLRKYHSLLSKRAALREEKVGGELAASEEYADLEERIAELDEEFSESNERFLDDAEFVGALRDLAGDEDLPGGAEGNGDGSGGGSRDEWADGSGEVTDR